MAGRDERRIPLLRHLPALPSAAGLSRSLLNAGERRLG
jgi:hypothetical protein